MLNSHEEETKMKEKKDNESKYVITQYVHMLCET